MATSEPEVNPVVSAPAALTGELTPEQRKARLEEIRRRMTLSTLSVEPPSGWKARWARRTDSQEMARLEYKGYQVVTDNPKSPRYKTTIRVNPEGNYIVGDVILMEVPEDVWLFLREQEQEKADLMANGPVEEFISTRAGEGVPTFERDRKGKVIKSHK